MSRIHDKLRAKLSSFDAELDYWDNAAKKTPFDKHASQITRINGSLRALGDALQTQINALIDDDNIFANNARLEKKILQAHEVLGFFREKFLLRSAEHFVPYLISADDYAWSCYKPFQEARAIDANFPGSDKNVPPLVYLSRRRSPAVLPRDRSFAGMISDLSDAACLALVARLPVSIISMPWYQSSSLPESVILAHEVGHVVEFDLALSAALDAALEGCAIPESRKEIWRRCRVEAFADMFGAAVGGSAFCIALIDLLRCDKTTVVVETVSDRGQRPSYPTRYLRVLLAIASLTTQPGREVGDKLLTQWRAEFGDQHAMMDFEDDVAALVQAFVHTDFALLGASIAAVGGMTEAQEKSALATAKNLGMRIAPSSSDARVLVAAAQHCESGDSAGYTQHGAEKLLLTRLVAARVAGKRSAQLVKPAEHDRDRQLGAQMADLLG